MRPKHGEITVKTTPGFECWNVTATLHLDPRQMVLADEKQQQVKEWMREALKNAIRQNFDNIPTPDIGGTNVVALNFSEEHAAKVEARTKKQTLRRTARAKVGDTIQLYTGQRTPACRKLSKIDPVCTRVGVVNLREEGMWFDGHKQDHSIIDGYAQLDGFKDYADMLAWFKDKYGVIPQPLYETRWDWPAEPHPIQCGGFL